MQAGEGDIFSVTDLRGLGLGFKDSSAPKKDIQAWHTQFL